MLGRCSPLPLQRAAGGRLPFWTKLQMRKPEVLTLGDPKRCWQPANTTLFLPTPLFSFRPKTRHRALPLKGETFTGPLPLQPPPLRLGWGCGGPQCSKSARHPPVPVGTTCTTISLVVGTATPGTPERILSRIMGLYWRFHDHFCLPPQERLYRRTSFW